MGANYEIFLPNKPCESPIPKLDKFHEVWKNNAEWRELALAKRGGKQHERLSEHTQDLKPLELGDNVMVQNLLGNNPKRWDKRGVVLEVLPNRQYKIKMDGSNRVSLRNRKHLRKFKPIVSEPQSLFSRTPASVSLPKKTSPLPRIIPEPISANHEVISPPEQTLPQLMHRDSGIVEQSPVPATPQPQVRQPAPVENNTPVAAPPIPAQMYTPPMVVSSTPVYQTPLVYTPISTAPSSSSDQFVPRRSGRSTQGQTSRYKNYATGSEYDESTAGIGSIPDYYNNEGQFLYAVQLPPGFEQISALWTGNQWIQWVNPLAAGGDS